MALIRRKHQTNPNWGAFYKVLNLPCSKESRSKKKNQGHGRKGMTRRLSQPERDCRDPVTKCNSWWLWMGPFDLKQQPPTFLVIGMGFMEDNFSMDKGEGMVSGWFSQGAHNLDPSHAQFTVEFTLLCEPNAATDQTGGRAQTVMRVMGSGCKYRWSLIHSFTIHLLCGPVPNKGVGKP